MRKSKLFCSWTVDLDLLNVNHINVGTENVETTYLASNVRPRKMCTKKNKTNGIYKPPVWLLHVFLWKFKKNDQQTTSFDWVFTIFHLLLFLIIIFTFIFDAPNIILKFCDSFRFQSQNFLTFFLLMSFQIIFVNTFLAKNANYFFL